MLRRATHAYCKFCGTNLSEYGQVQCDSCLLDLTSSEMVVYSTPHKPVSILVTFKLRIKSRIRKLKRRSLGGRVSEGLLCQRIKGARDSDAATPRGGGVNNLKHYLP